MLEWETLENRGVLVFLMTDLNMTFSDFNFKRYLEEMLNCTYEQIKHP